MKVKSFRKYTFSILILLSICSIWSIYSYYDLNIIKKTILMCLNLTYLFLIAEYMELIIYSNMIVNVFSYKNIVPSSIFKLIYVVLPIISMLIYVFAWVLLLSNSVFDVQTTAVLIIMSESFIISSIFMKNNVIFANENGIIIGFHTISYHQISNYNSSKRNIMGIDVEKIEVELITGEKLTFSVDSKKIYELIENIKNNVNKD